MAVGRAFGNVTAYRVRSENCGWASTPEGVLVIVNASQMIVQSGASTTRERFAETSELIVGVSQGADGVIDDRVGYVGDTKEDLKSALEWIRTGR